MAVVKCFLPSDLSTNIAQHYYIVDLDAELPADNLTGDIAYSKGSTTFWTATAPGVWIPVSGSGTLRFTAENKDIVTIFAGQPVAIHSSGTGVVRANATDNTKNCIGLAVEDIAVGASGKIQTDGPLTIADWTAAAGTVTLAAKARYFLDTTSGKITTVAPTTISQVVQVVGYESLSDTLEIEVDDTILL